MAVKYNVVSAYSLAVRTPALSWKHGSESHCVPRLKNMFEKIKGLENAEQKLKEWQEKAYQDIKDRGDEVLQDDSHVVIVGDDEYIITEMIYTKQMLEDLKNFKYIDAAEEERKLINSFKG